MDISLLRSLTLVLALAGCSQRVGGSLTVGTIDGVEGATTRYRDVAVAPGPVTVGLTVDGAIQLFRHGPLAPGVDPQPAFSGYYAAMSVAGWGEAALIHGLSHGGSAEGVVIAVGGEEPPTMRSLGNTPYLALGGNCGVDKGNNLACYQPEGLPAAANLDAPQGLFDSVDATPELSCATSRDGGLACWGGEPPELSSPRAVSRVLVFGDVPVGIGAEGELMPLGPGALPDALQRLPAGAYNDVQLAGTYACGLQSDGTVVCAGRPPADAEGRALKSVLRPPEGAFRAIGVGRTHACAVRVDASLVCWGACEGEPSACIEPPGL